jgi:hypothetical protein
VRFSPFLALVLVSEGVYVHHDRRVRASGSMENLQVKYMISNTFKSREKSNHALMKYEEYHGRDTTFLVTNKRGTENERTQEETRNSQVCDEQARRIPAVV